MTTTASHTTTSREQWLAARRALLSEEKKLTAARDEVARRRRELPWVRVDQDYVFDTPEVPQTLAEVFGPHSQLIVYHFMFGPDWDEGCVSCSFWMDNFDGIDVHLAHRDTAFIAVSRAPLQTLQAYRERMGWRFRWVSSLGTSFNYDFGVSFTEEQQTSGADFNFAHSTNLRDELPGLSIFAKDAGGDVYHTYSTYSRGLDPLNGAYQLLDLVPKGRDEQDLPWSMAWLNRRDQCDENPAA
jgi:predicted dithiol-disulfide oxidoreductase (DUF899 family)